LLILFESEKLRFQGLYQSPFYGLDFYIFSRKILISQNLIKYLGLDMPYKVKVSEGGTIYLPAKIRKALGINPKDEVLLSLEGDKVILRPLKSVFALGAKRKKIVNITVEEFERESEKMQSELYEE